MNLIPSILFPGHADRRGGFERPLIEGVSRPYPGLDAKLGIKRFVEQAFLNAQIQTIAQLGLIISTWIFLVCVQWNNDGLWFQPDSGMHGLNGIFWGDFVRAHTLNALDYAQRYFVRYPGINPTSYPPLFYWLEAVVFAFTGPSPFIAKGMVLLFALLGALYTRLWLCRYVAPQVGYLAAMVLLLPTMVTFSHAVMLNVPAAALMLAGLYHTRRWLDQPQSRQLYPAALFSVASVLCYFPSVVVVPIIAAWVIVLGPWSLLLQPRVILTAIVGAVILVPSFLLAMQWSTSHVAMTSLSVPMLSQSYPWLYYPKLAPGAFTWPLLLLAGFGAVSGLFLKNLRVSTIVLTLWLVIEYLFLSYLKAKEDRYILPLGFPLVGLAGVAVVSLQAMLDKLKLQANSPVFMQAVSLGLVSWLGYQAWVMPSRQVNGMREIAEFLAAEAPTESVFYDGRYHSLFTYYVRASDSGMTRGVVRGDKLLYTYKMSRGLKAEEFASSPAEVLELLKTDSGCQYLVVESDPGPKARMPGIWLREMVKQEPFELVRSFELSGSKWSNTIDVYRITVPIEHPTTFDIPVPTAGSNARMHAAPL